MNEIVEQTSSQYQELKTELALCRIGGLFLALYEDENVPGLIMAHLQKDLPNYFQFSLPIIEKEVGFPIFFAQNFEQIGKHSNIFHVFGIEALSEASKNELVQYLQYGRERFKPLSYSIVFWVHPPFVNQLFHGAPDFHHWLFGTYDFTDEKRSLENIQAFHQKNKQDFLKCIDQYLKNLLRQYMHWQTVKNKGDEFLLEVMNQANRFDDYVKLYGTDEEGKVSRLDNLLETFLANDKQSLMILLGDLGTGKSAFSLHSFMIQAKRYLLDKSQPIPLFISLKDYPGEINIETFIKKLYDQFGLPVSLAAFQDLALQGKFLFFVDGFDEMLSMSAEQKTIENFKELTKLSFENPQLITQTKRRKTNKILLTCRTHYFFTDAQAQKIFTTDKTLLERGSLTKSHCQAIRINMMAFSQAQVKKYVLKSVGSKKSAEQLLELIQNTYHLKELSTQPLLLKMIVKTLLAALKDNKQINAAELYKAYTNSWIEREDWRSQMTEQGKREFMWELAAQMYKKGGDFSVPYSELNKPKSQFLKRYFEYRDKDYYQYEVTACAFLKRDSDGNYQFIHNSFMEYFLAEYLFDCLQKTKAGLVKYSETNKKVKCLLSYSETNKKVQFFINGILSENKKALTGLDLSHFGLNNINLKTGNIEGAILEHTSFKSANLEWANLERAKLEGAKLQFARLKGANLQGATLKKVYLKGKYLANMNLQEANLQEANLQQANLQQANLQQANLREANLQEANLQEANLKRANLEGANFEGANLEGANLEETKIVETNFEGANLEGANLEGANLEGAYLEKANLEKANLEGTNLKGANLKGAYLKGAYLKGANFEGAKNLEGAIGLPKNIFLGTNISILSKLWLKVVNKLPKSLRRIVVGTKQK